MCIPLMEGDKLLLELKGAQMLEQLYQGRVQLVNGGVGTTVVT